MAEGNDLRRKKAIEKWERDIQVTGTSWFIKEAEEMHFGKQKRSGAVLVLSLLIVLAGCGKKDTAQAAGPPPAPVVAGKVEQRDIPVQLNAIGNVESFQTVQIRSQVNGQ